MTNVSQTRSFTFFLLSVLALFLSVIFITQATTVGSNVDVSGNLTVAGTAAVTGNSTFTGSITGNGSGTFGDAAADIYNFVAGLTASSTLGVTGTTFLYGNVHLNGYATTTAATGNIRTEGNVGVATTTSMTTGVVFGVEGTATTTIAIGTSSGTKGSCLQMDGPDGNTYRIYPGATTTDTGVLRIDRGSCNEGN
ncbi:hypothetical protein HYT00_03480 [Candidatus Giovannonibacteria bacterium]|nr:hypothetical protein [Candidatus Giovannonibacteria bacterium]